MICFKFQGNILQLDRIVTFIMQKSDIVRPHFHLTNYLLSAHSTYLLLDKSIMSKTRSAICQDTCVPLIMLI